jgi:hypothetical protein
MTEQFSTLAHIYPPGYMHKEVLQMTIVRFMGTPAGRLARIVAGLAMMAVGAWLAGPWWALFAVGLVPLTAGIANLCLLAPLFHAPLRPVARQA